MLLPVCIWTVAHLSHGFYVLYVDTQQKVTEIGCTKKLLAEKDVGVAIDEMQGNFNVARECFSGDRAGAKRSGSTAAVYVCLHFVFN